LDLRYDVADLEELGPNVAKNFINALLDLKKAPSKTHVPPGNSLPQPTNRYDDFVMMHMMSFGVDPGVSMIAHQSPTFLPWHRAFLRLFERELQKIKPEYKDVTIPYWDWTSDASNNAIWDEEFMGGDGRESDWRVMNGKFAFDSGKWTLYTAPNVHPVAYERPDLRRRFGYYMEDNVLRNLRLPIANHVKEALETDPYDGPPWITNPETEQPQPSYRNRLEGGYGLGRSHNIVHVWVGGMIVDDDNMTDCGAMAYGGSPNDPVFWLHHSNIDRLWADWQLHKDEQIDHWALDHKGYLPVSGGPVSLNVDDPMLPWRGSVTPSSVANFYRIDSKGYRYNKYFRDDTKDREETLGQRTDEMKAAAIGPTIDSELFETNLSLIKAPFDEYLKVLKKPLYPID
jgi:tyrosinase